MRRNRPVNGGPGVVVEVDETLVTRRKYNRGRIIRHHQWMFGGIERVSGYQHMVVNHSLHFVDPTTGAHTKNVESLWQKFKAVAKRRLWKDLIGYGHNKLKDGALVNAANSRRDVSSYESAVGTMQWRVNGVSNWSHKFSKRTTIVAVRHDKCGFASIDKCAASFGIVWSSFGIVWSSRAAWSPCSRVVNLPPTSSKEKGHRCNY
ncbi:hypothetical protein ANCCEY_02025 [Ancylostoma ceylanicum]|uniref:ISXO2-like transposase domain-containing protein n=1 Tax=Ancylostoma ceylanicum TaxID=53326 RepID=A0A0D6M5U1_9BILA|nr:hypothetical protein ANCCEY_02025 [Ancylostoma ceylanicum]